MGNCRSSRQPRSSRQRAGFRYWTRMEIGRSIGASYGGFWTFRWMQHCRSTLAADGEKTSGLPKPFLNTACVNAPSTEGIDCILAPAKSNSPASTATRPRTILALVFRISTGTRVKPWKKRNSMRSRITPSLRSSTATGMARLPKTSSTPIFCNVHGRLRFNSFWKFPTRVPISSRHST